MSAALATIIDPELPALPTEILERAANLAAASKSLATLRAYDSAWRSFSSWCRDHQQRPLPAEPGVVAAYLADLGQTRKVSTITKHSAAIAEAHRIAGYASPTEDARVRAVLSGLRRTLGVRPQQKAPILVPELRRMLAALPKGLIGIRDRALLLTGFASGCRRSEIVGLDVADLDFRDDGLVLLIRHSKTDQEGRGRQVGLPYGSNPDTCPVRTTRSWLAQSSILDGPVFRGVDRHGQLGERRLSDRAVALIVKRAAALVGIDPARVAGHSLRSGLATSAAMAGASERSIQKQTGHRSLQVLRGYIRDGSLFNENAAAVLGL